MARNRRRASRVAVGYCRVSTAGQAAEGVSLEAQKARFLGGVSAYYVEQLARERRIPCVRLAGTARAGRQREGRKVRFRASDLRAWADAQVDSGNGR